MTDGSGYCAAHVRPGSFADHHRGSRQDRGYGAAWERVRKAVLRRDKGLCQVCLVAGRYRPATQVDHINPKCQGGTDDESNLQAICTACHKVKTASEAQAGRG